MNDPLKVSVLREELVKLTGDSNKAIVLNQFVYWSERTRTAEGFVREEIKRAEEYMNGDTEVLNGLAEDLKNGWIYKSAEELIEDTMITVSRATMSRIIGDLIKHGWLLKRRNPRYKADNTPQYRVDLVKLQLDLYEIGYSLNGYRLIMNFVDYAKVREMKRKYDGYSHSEKGSSHHENILNHSEKISSQNEKVYSQIEQTLPEITTEDTLENTKQENIPEFFKTEEEENNNNKKENEKFMIGQLEKWIRNDHDLKNVVLTLRGMDIGIKDCYDIGLYLIGKEKVDMNIVKQQLLWMKDKVGMNSGIGDYGKYFVNGYEKRLVGKNGERNTEESLDTLLGINKGNMDVSMHDWLNE